MNNSVKAALLEGYLIIVDYSFATILADSSLVNACLDNVFSLFVHRYLYADDPRLARPHMRLPHTTVSPLRITLQVEGDFRRRRGDLRIMAKTHGRPLCEDLPV